MPIATTTIIGGLALAAAAYYATRADDKDTDELEPSGLLPPGLFPGLTTGIKKTIQPTQSTFQPTQPDGQVELGEPSFGGGSTPTGYPWETNPPALSGSYDEDLFPDFHNIRKTMYFLGYATPSTMFGFEIDSPPAASEVRRFQRHYNKASERAFRSANGYLKDDGIAGKGTLRALEYAAFGTDKGTLDDILRGPEWSQEFDV
jgi:hypothetical protein